jgi:hypothetical protein
MAMPKKRIDFQTSDEGRDFRQKLLGMTADGSYNTSSSYSTNSRYPDNLIPFVDRHMNYLSTHPKLEAGKYLANLKLMTKVR